MFFLQQNWRTGGQNRFFLEVWVGWGGEVAQIMCIHVGKCKNDKIKFKKIVLFLLKNAKTKTKKNKAFM
jgi:hypothetical protein